MHRAASTFRHRFHQRHFKSLTGLLLTASVIELMLLFFLRKQIVYNGLWLGLGVIVYVIINRWLKYFKEVAAALLYTSGVLLPAFSLKQSSFSTSDLLVIAQFFVIVLTNLILFSWMDYERDVEDQRDSLVTQSGQKRVRIIILFLFAFFFLLTLFAPLANWRTSVVLISMDMVLFLIFLLPNTFRRDERFRFLGDAIFFLPILTFIL
jgi:4-hydroxybenzoate polyprenyltransferase